MPVPAPNLYPPFNIIRLSHVELAVTDLAKSRAFYTDTLGMQLTAVTGDKVYMRAREERGHHSIVLHQQSQACANFLGFKVYDEENLDKAAHFFNSRGLPVDWVDRPQQSRTFRTRDLHGIPLEFYCQMERLPPIHQQSGLHKSVKPFRIDHFNCISPDVDASIAFYKELGFRVTEYAEDEETGSLCAAWTHRKGGVHDMAFTNGHGPRLHHTALRFSTPSNIIDLLDLMSSTGWSSNVERGPGHHDTSNAFFLYIRDPDGHRIEIYCSDNQTVDPAFEPIKRGLMDPQCQTLWGTSASKSWFEEGAIFAGSSVQAPSLSAQPIVAP
ncbi:3,4-dihydroxyphenylacetate 2,3-dioxygenase [Roseibium sediminis]|uniref:3,4-dihydroxyphenylacetate 2,3-dioxygenase n=1 Tax=Roseibium sediminis TaxID=1775174 RepID=UPI00123D087D|nr:3,4-dihydroxyphenylacetate 2,3-dioxygenase [Roseibium sediminis]